MVPEKNSWIYRFINLANHMSQWSKDNIKVCSVIVDSSNKVLSTGYNGMPSWFNDEFLQDLGEDKNKIITHAEVNSLNCLSSEHYDKELTLFVNRPPCIHCAKFIVYSYINIKTVYYTADNITKDYSPSLALFDKHHIKHVQLETK